MQIVYSIGSSLCLQHMTVLREVHINVNTKSNKKALNTLPKHTAKTHIHIQKYIQKANCYPLNTLEKQDKRRDQISATLFWTHLVSVKPQQGCISGFLLALRWFAVKISRLSRRIISLPNSVYRPLPNIWLLVFGTLSEYIDPELGREVSVRGWPCEDDKGNTTHLTRTTFIGLKMQLYVYSIMKLTMKIFTVK